MNEVTKHRGHCRCDGVSVSISGEPEMSIYCHCDDCRRSTGGPLLASIGVMRDKITWESSEGLARFRKGTATRLFCKNCGSPVAQEHDSKSDMTFFNTGFMAVPEAFPPTYHSFAGQQISWLKLNDDLPRLEKTLLIETK
jgi:hypothetical protein